MSMQAGALSSHDNRQLHSQRVNRWRAEMCAAEDAAILQLLAENIELVRAEIIIARLEDRIPVAEKALGRIGDIQAPG